MVWDIGFQDKIVYLVVSSAAVYLSIPLVSSLKSLFSKTKTQEASFGCYEAACSACEVKIDKNQKVLPKRKQR